MKKQSLRALAAVCLCAALACPASAVQTGYVDIPGGAWYASAVEEISALGYMTGVDETHFAPEGTVTRATVAAVLWRMAGSPAPEAAALFSDVPAESWYAQAVAWAQQAGVAQGDGSGCFYPQQAVSRQELAVFLTRYDLARGTSLAQGALNLFSDAADIADWAQEGVAHAVGMGWLEGSDGRISPQGSASRAQLAQILQRMLTPAMG